MQTLTRMALAFELTDQGLNHTKIVGYIDSDGMVEEPIEIAVAMTGSPKTSPQAPRDELEKQVGVLPINGV